MWSKARAIVFSLISKIRRALGVSPSIGDRIQKLLDTDANNTGVAVELMEALDPKMVELFQDTANVFREILARVGRRTAEANEDAKLKAIAKGLNITNEQLAAGLVADPRSQPNEAQVAWARLGALRDIRMLVLACQRYWVWGASDLLRLRLSSATGYLRLEAETVGLMKLFMDEPAVANQWFTIADKKAGKQFFNATQSRVRAALEGFELDATYDIASSGSQHVRLAGLVRSFASTGGEMRLPDQDVDPDDPYNFHLTIAHFHKTQGRVIAALAKVVPGVADDTWPQVYNPFASRINKLWDTLEHHYAGQVAASDAE